jgi:hypothetical protein
MSVKSVQFTVAAHIMAALGYRHQATHAVGPENGVRRFENRLHGITLAEVVRKIRRTNRYFFGVYMCRL